MSERPPIRAVRLLALLLASFWILSYSASAQSVSNRYALILEDPPVGGRFSGRTTMQSTEARSYEQQIQTRQRTVKDSLAEKKITVTGSVSTLLNAVFVVATPDRLDELKNLPGVVGVVPLRTYHRKLNRAAQLVNAPAAWNALGGAQNAGAGIKIGILDSGIDQNNAAFQDSTLKAPAGYPKCSGSDCAFTNNKVIVARSYVRQIAAGTSAANPAADSRPDDYSPRDHDGHGTGVASCAAGNAVTTGKVPISGIAPKAFLGNYKIYGSPQVNDTTTDDVIIQAVEDAVKDGMDVVNFSSGGPAFTGPLDTGSVCGNAANIPCDATAQAFETAAKNGLIIVASAGNEGSDGNNFPTFNSIGSPANAPSVIAVGATTNSHYFLETVDVPGESSLQGLTTDSGDGYVPTGAVTLPLRDVTAVGDDGLACTDLPTGSLVGTIALIKRGACNFSTKFDNAINAGALGVIFYMADGSTLISPGNVGVYGYPVVMVSNTDGLALKNLVARSPNHLVTINPAGMEQDDTANANQLVSFSSLGPTTGDAFIKPDLVAPGTSIYMAAESYDPLGELYGADGFAVADGTSFSSPIVAGAAALVKQKHPTFTAAQIRSAVINTASQDVTTDDNGDPVDVQWLGAGKLDAGAAVNATVVAIPTSLSYAVLKTTTTLPLTKQVTLTNTGSSAVTLNIDLVNNSTISGTTTAVTPSTLSLNPGASGTVTVTVGGNVPVAGSYSGALRVQGTNVSLRVPYLYLVGTGVASNIIPLTGDSNDGTVGQGIPDGIISFKLVDQYGLAVPNAPVTWSSRGGGKLIQSDATTDANGIATAQPVLGSAASTYTFTARTSGLSYTFTEYARNVPAITAAGVLNAASLETGKPIAPGSYISIFGTNLSDFSDSYSGARLPLAIDYVNVSFDVPSANISVPGRLVYVSANQVNVQVPWELQGQTSAQVKVTIDYTVGNVVTVPISNYTPALFEAPAGSVAALDANNQVITSSHPATRGQVVQLFGNGFGPVNNQPATGENAPSSPLAQTTTLPTVTIGGQPAAVSFSGLAPGFAALYQLNVTVPSSLAPGTYPVVVTIGGVSSKASNIIVQ